MEFLDDSLRIGTAFYRGNNIGQRLCIYIVCGKTAIHGVFRPYRHTRQRHAHAHGTGRALQ